MNLVLHLKKEYFDQIASGEKVEEYRLITGYWSQRLEGRTYENVILLCGYPAANDESKKIVRPWYGYERKTITHKHFGSSSVEVYVIHLTPNNACTRPCPRCGCYGGHYLGCITYTAMHNSGGG